MNGQEIVIIVYKMFVSNESPLKNKTLPLYKTMIYTQKQNYQCKCRSRRSLVDQYVIRSLLYIIDSEQREINNGLKMMFTNLYYSFYSLK